MSPAPKAPRKLTGPYTIIEPEMTSGTRFARNPSQVLILATLEVTISDSHGSYILVTSPRYDTRDEAPGIGSSHWNPPFVAEVVPQPRNREWDTVGQVMEAIEKAKTSGIKHTNDQLWRPEIALADAAATWACGIYELEFIEHLTEYKRSWSEPENMKVYHIIRYRPKKLDDCKPRALGDPESRKGFTYLPLDEKTFAATVCERDCERSGTELTFVGKPLVTNLAYVLKSPTNRERLRTEALPIPREDFYADHEGLLFCGDIANYGAACNFAGKYMQGIEDDGDTADAKLRDRATYAIDRIFLEAGLSQVHTAGDGFTVTAPFTDGTPPAEIFARFLEAYRRFTDVLDELTGKIADHQQGKQTVPVLGSRLAIHHGSYRYGKTALAISSETRFSGAAITEVNRTEQGLRTITKLPDQCEEFGIDGNRHVVLVSDAARTVLGVPTVKAKLNGNGKSVTLFAKEAKIKGRVYQFAPR